MSAPSGNVAAHDPTPLQVRRCGATECECSSCSTPNDEERSPVDETVGPTVVQRQAGGGTPTGGGSGGGSTCSIPADCPEDFCTPLPGGRVQALAEIAASAPVLLAGIGVKVDPRVMPLWSNYIFGGSAPRNLTSEHGADFTASKTTERITDLLVEDVKDSLMASPPTFPPGSDETTIDLTTTDGIKDKLDEVDQPGDYEMDFDEIGEIPGNIAGGIGADQLTCSVGARPSPFNDVRKAAGTAVVRRDPATGGLTVTVSITYKVKDTIDLCPGNCGADIEQIATVRLSRWEASGASGDVPYTVDFPAPVRTFTMPGPPPTAPPKGPITGTVRPRRHTAPDPRARLRIREGPSTTDRIVGRYPAGASIKVLCQTTGTEVEGDPTWDKTDKGWVSDHYVDRDGTDAPPDC